MKVQAWKYAGPYGGWKIVGSPFEANFDDAFLELLEAPDVSAVTVTYSGGNQIRYVKEA